jgi:hypothetical protein
MIVGSWKQANALIDSFRSVYVFAKWPCNRLLGQRLKSRVIGKFDSQLTNRTMCPLSVKENLCSWRCLMPDACSEWQQFLAFRGSLPAKRKALPGFPSHLVRPCETLGSTTSRHTLRDFRNRNVSLDPSRLWEPLHLVRPCETLGTATSRQTLRDSRWQKVWSDFSKLCEPYTVPTDEGFCVMLLSIEKGSGPLGPEPFLCSILLRSRGCSRNLR